MRFTPASYWCYDEVLFHDIISLPFIYIVKYFDSIGFRRQMVIQ